MDKYLLSPNFGASRPRSNSLSHNPYYLFSASAPCHRRDAVIFILNFSRCTQFQQFTKFIALQPLRTPSQAQRLCAVLHGVTTPSRLHCLKCPLYLPNSPLLSIHLALQYAVHKLCMAQCKFLKTPPFVTPFLNLRQFPLKLLF